MNKPRNHFYLLLVFITTLFCIASCSLISDRYLNARLDNGGKIKSYRRVNAGQKVFEIDGYYKDICFFYHLEYYPSGPYLSFYKKYYASWGDTTVMLTYCSAYDTISPIRFIDSPFPDCPKPYQFIAMSKDDKMILKKAINSYRKYSKIEAAKACILIDKTMGYVLISSQKVIKDIPHMRFPTQ